MPLMRNCRDSSMSLVKAIETLKCEAKGGRVGRSWKYFGPSRCEWRIA